MTSFAEFVTNMYDGMYIEDLNTFELRMVRRLVNDGFVRIIKDGDMGLLVRKKK